MPSNKHNHKNKNSDKNNSKNNNNEEIKVDSHDIKIHLIKRTLENNTHEVIEDIKLKNITSWRKSKTKFLHNLIFNILSLGILHIISLFYPNLYLKLYCNPWPPKECDFFLVENIYGEFTLCTKIFKKSKNNDNNMNYNSDATKNNMASSSIINSNNKIDFYLTKNLSYSFKYKSVTYEYNEDTNEISPVYMNISKMTNKGIFNYFGEGLSSDNSVKKFQERYGKNEYYINIGITYFYFKKIEKNYFILIIIVKLFDLATKDFFPFLLFATMIFIITLVEYYISKNIIYKLYEKENTLDGEKNKLKVKRRNKLSNNSNFFGEIKNCDLLPGDVIYLKENDFVPCDCLILEGECIVDENNLTGSHNIFKKTSLKNTNEQFNYKVNKINTLYHGMKIVKTYSKLNERYISLLCINTGPNTYKANLFSNILYMFERKKEYKNMYETFGEGRKNIFFLILFTLVVSMLLIFLFLLFFDSYSIDKEYVKKLKNIWIIIAKIISKSFMPVYFLTNSVIYIISIIHLKNQNIFCFDKSRLINASRINTIFFSKTSLSENKYEINGYHPLYITSHKSNNLGYKTFNLEQYKEMNAQLLKFYKDYLFKNQITNNYDFSIRSSLRLSYNKINNNKINNECNEYMCLFLECLLSCNNIEKINTEIFGNPIEKEFFLNLRWDIKPYNFYKIQETNDSYENYNQLNDYNDNDKITFDNYFNLIDKRINDIYPNNYFKITESLNNEIKFKNKILFTRTNSRLYETKNNNNDINCKQDNNFIKYNISKTHVKTYKLRIYKRFIKNGTLNSSAIVYNFITKELRFMTKGIPEDILDKCDINTLPVNIDNIFSLYRKMGFIIIICASKIINIDSYDDSTSIDEYMCNLTFCGFITLKNKIKKTVLNSIKELHQFNCNLIMTTGDNVYNALSVGFASNIIENKNIFAFEKDDKNRIIIKKLYKPKKLNEDEKEDDIKQNSSSLVKSSKYTSKGSNSEFYKLKENIILSRKKRRNNEFFRIQLNHDSEKRQLNFDDKKEIKEAPTHNFIRKRGHFKKKFKATKNVLEHDKSLEKDIFPNNPHPLFDYNHRNNNKEMDMNINSRIIDYDQSNIYDTIKRSTSFHKSNKKKVLDKKETLESNMNKTNRTNNEIKCKINFEKYYYYPKIFEEHEDLADNCIYCVSGKVINFLYKNKDKKYSKHLLQQIHKHTKIFFSMSSLDKSLTIDYYRECPDSCVCTIGECYSDCDAIITSNIGINLMAPKNRNTILCHFYSGDSNFLSIKKIIREGRTVNENILLLRISSTCYTIIINSYIVCCFLKKYEGYNLSLSLLEIAFLIISISAFTTQYDNSNASNCLIQNKRLYFCHYLTQIIGIIILKFLAIYFQCHFFIRNPLLEKERLDQIFCSYYFIFCVEQLLSTIFLFNLISFYRKNPLSNNFFILFNLLLLIYIIILLTLSSSNFNYDIFGITYFEYLENLIDTFDDNNKMNSFKFLAIDFFSSYIFSRLVYFIFYKLAEKKT